MVDILNPNPTRRLGDPEPEDPRHGEDPKPGDGYASSRRVGDTDRKES